MLAFGSSVIWSDNSISSCFVSQLAKQIVGGYGVLAIVCAVNLCFLVLIICTVCLLRLWRGRHSLLRFVLIKTIVSSKYRMWLTFPIRTENKGVPLPRKAEGTQNQKNSHYFRSAHLLSFLTPYIFSCRHSRRARICRVLPLQRGGIRAFRWSCLPVHIIYR